MCSGRAGETVSGYPDNNPKTVVGLTKPSISKIPPAALEFIAEGMSNFTGMKLSDVPSTAVIYMAVCMMDGARKYGPFNWRENAVTASIYVDATMRHIFAFMDGEVNAADSGRPHLGHALASLAILIDAYEIDKLVDDRPPSGANGFNATFLRRFEDLLKSYDRDETFWYSDAIDCAISCLLTWWNGRDLVNHKQFLVAAITSLAILSHAIEIGKASSDVYSGPAPHLIAQFTIQPSVEDVIEQIKNGRKKK